MHLPVFSPEVPEYKTLEELNPKTIFVGHNVVFDISMISKFWLKIEKYIDNLQIAKHLLQEEEEKFENSYRQEVLKYYLMEKWISFPEAKAHDAMGDVQIARVIFKHFFDLIGKRYDLNSNDAIISKMLELSGSPILLLKFNFGKYKWTTFEEVAWNDLSYIDWLYRNSQDENIRFTCGKYL
ncbi:MAG: exonuclease RNase T and DNA polymerase III [uncultured bacterium (gcode 4)]|uniref:Exonuclease RNase T and DNA polymerase III n=1 Tax=uncultured bacterium (gcode 4) TaxID=1234023 RepID=K2H290_9BACT|nr:MAG: exonuclease RNase T and DNA polymerase III [uncultured bacterium (gcode 4)]